MEFVEIVLQFHSILAYAFSHRKRLLGLKIKTAIRLSETRQQQGMYRFRIIVPDSDRIRYGVPLTEALTTDLEPNMVYFVSANNVLKVEVGLYGCELNCRFLPLILAPYLQIESHRLLSFLPHMLLLLNTQFRVFAVDAIPMKVKAICVEWTNEDILKCLKVT